MNTEPIIRVGYGLFVTEKKCYPLLLQDNKTGLLLERCPFCNEFHKHSIGSGHRQAHCPDTKFPPFNNNNSRAILINEMLIHQEDGYYLI